ncbi:MAG: TetR/AcrR family transcriptional regulator [Hyphomicrobiales bacterium]|nr:TetR/AcrR family transcriptional regulator [Hyphomicrobiales bacterium]
MSRKPSRRSIGAVRSPESHRSILAAAREILDRDDYAGFSIEAVARRAGASKPTIYRWWKSKAALIMEVYESERETALAVPDLGSIEQELIIRMRNLWQLWRRTPLGAALRSIIAEAQIDAEALAQLRDDFLPKRKSSTMTLFARAIARGELAAEADVETANTLIYSFNWLYLLTDQLKDERAVDDHVRMIVAGLKCRAGKPTAVLAQPVNRRTTRAFNQARDSKGRSTPRRLRAAGRGEPT